MLRAQQHEVVERGFATICPVLDVMAMQEPMIAAAGKHTTVVVARPHGANYHVPMEKLADEAGSRRSKNMVALGAICEMFGFPIDGLEDGIRRKFASKSEKIVESNIKAVSLGATRKPP